MLIQFEEFQSTPQKIKWLWVESSKIVFLKEEDDNTLETRIYFSGEDKDFVKVYGMLLEVRNQIERANSVC